MFKVPLTVSLLGMPSALRFAKLQVMQSTNQAAARQETELEQKLRSRSGMHAQVGGSGGLEGLQGLWVAAVHGAADERARGATCGGAGIADGRRL